jgi:hypothetical protein
MLRDIAEPDWKVFRKLRTIALERFCDRVLAEVGHIAGDAGKTSHERYLAVFKLIEQRDRELADAFNGMRRSRARQQLACICSHGLLTEDEMSGFSPETRQVVRLLLGLEPD